MNRKIASVHDLKKNKLLIPNYNKHNLIDLIRTVYNYCGLNFKNNKNMKYLKKYIKNNENIIFILVDGFGYNLVKAKSSEPVFMDCEGFFICNITKPFLHRN